MSGSHTPTPWKVSPGHAEGAVTVRQDGGEFQRPVAEVWHNGDDPKANAEFIVTAVNSYASSQAEIERLKAALEPFAKAADIKLCGEWRDDERFGQTDVSFHLTFGDLREARAALSGSKE